LENQGNAGMGESGKRRNGRIRELEESLVVLAKILGSYGDAADVR